MLMGGGAREAKIHYLDGTFRMLSAGDHVRCAITGAIIPLDELRYWSVERQEAYADAAASLEAGEHLMAPARALLDAAGVAYETDVGVGDVAHTLVDMIERSGCDMVIIGAKGQGAITSALLGSVSHEVAHASPVPVTIVKHAEVLEGADSDIAEDAEV